LSSHHPQELRGFLEAAVLRGSQPDEALRRLDALAGRHTEVLRGLTKRIQDARLSRDNGAVRAAIQQYDDALDAYIPGGG
jgi:tetratricopeptide repeat protein 30